MTEREQFEAVLEELARVVGKVSWLDGDAVLIGGQVVAVEQLAAGHPEVFEIQSRAGARIRRPFSMEPDLLVTTPAFEESARWDELPHALREIGFRRSDRTFRWVKEVGGQPVLLDLFVPDDGGEVSTDMTRLEDGERVLRRAREVQVPLKGTTLRIKVPSPADFVRLKLDNLDRDDRPEKKKINDALDIYAYIRVKGPEVVAESVVRTMEERTSERLEHHFGAAGSASVKRVLAMVPARPERAREQVVEDVVGLTRSIVRNVALARERERSHPRAQERDPFER